MGTPAAAMPDVPRLPSWLAQSDEPPQAPPGIQLGQPLPPAAAARLRGRGTGAQALVCGGEKCSEIGLILALSPGRTHQTQRETWGREGKNDCSVREFILRREKRTSTARKAEKARRVAAPCHAPTPPNPTSHWAAAHLLPGSAAVLPSGSRLHEVK